MSALRSSQSSRSESFKAIDSAEDSRRKRSEQQVQIRKSAREEAMKKKRNIDFSEASVPDTTAPASSSSKHSTSTQQKLIELPRWVEDCNSADPARQFNGTQNIRKMLSVEKHPPISEIVQTNVVPRLIQLLTCVDYPKLQFESAWALTNIASGSSEDTMTVVNNGAVPYFIELLKSPDNDVREQATWALGNIAGESTELRDFLLHHQCMVGFIYSLGLAFATPAPSEGLIKNSAWAISNLCRGKPEPNFALVSPVLPTLLKLLHQRDDDLLIDVGWALSYLSDGENDKVQAVIDAGVVPRLAELLLHHSVGVKTPALRTIGNLVTGDDHQTEAVLKHGILASFLALLNSSKKNLRKEACWAISNITAGSKTQIQAVLDADLVPSLIRCLSDSDFETKKEACWSITNATSGGSKAQIASLVKQGVLKPLCKLLASSDSKVIGVALDGLENILKNESDSFVAKTGKTYVDMIEEVEGIDYIENLQQHENITIYDKAVAILEKYFQAAADDAENYDTANSQPAVATNAAGQQTFSFNFAPPPQTTGGFEFKF